jgi:hypothetical protein
MLNFSFFLLQASKCLVMLRERCQITNILKLPKGAVNFHRESLSNFGCRIFGALLKTLLETFVTDLFVLD